jgi:hypothetical protein
MELFSSMWQATLQLALRSLTMMAIASAALMISEGKLQYLAVDRQAA